MTTFRNRMTTLAAALAVLATAGLSTARGDEKVNHAAFVAARTLSLVTVKFVMKIKMGGMGNREQEGEITAVMIDPKGVVLCSNTQLGGISASMRRMMQTDISIVPSELKILIGDDTEGIDAELVARDSELDLAWVRIKDAGDKKFDAVDLTDSALAELGQRVIAVRRMGRFFARTVVVAEGRVGGITKKPRDLYIPTGNIGNAVGLPIYTTAGKILGVTIIQMPDSAEMGGFSSFQESAALVILPAADVVKATKRALASVEEDEGE
jgi:S1-C subfamily serine protease